MRRASYTPLPAEPLIVVEESGGTEDEEEAPSRGSSPHLNLCPDSPLLNPGLLSPYRDMRKRSLPTPSCTTGITASQVRRLSEHGTADSAGVAAREAAFLATLSQAPAPAPGGRRHSVVTISRAPPPSILFGRGRRESIAAFPSGGPPARILPSRRDSTPRPPSTSGSTSGSQFNLQLDIMDDIAEIKAARKVRLKMWKTPSKERVCEVQPLDGDGTSPSTMYHQQPSPMSRRYSDFVPTPQPSCSQPRRRASEQVPASTSTTGIVCSNTDLISIISSLASSAQEIDKVPADEKRRGLKNLRSNSFDASMLLGTGRQKQKDADGKVAAGPSSWFAKRHQPRRSLDAASLTKPSHQETRSEPTSATPARNHKVVWDGKSGSVVDAQVLGSAIENFLARRESDSPSKVSPTKGKGDGGGGGGGVGGGESGAWFAKDEDTCDSSLCSTIKDLFVK